MIIKICSRKEIQKLVHSVFPEKTAVISYFGEGENSLREYKSYLFTDISIFNDWG